MSLGDPLPLKCIFNTMKTFKWHGIPVNIPNKKIEFQIIGAIILIEIVIISYVVFKVL